jgi:hypothetical protein
MIRPRHYNLTKDHVLSKVTEEEILEHYMQQPFAIKGPLFRNVHREDANPTCSYYYGDGFAGVKDWQGWYNGGCFGLVMKIYSCGFRDALYRIVEDMRLGTRPVTTSNIVRRPAKRKEIRVKRREWNNEDLAFWEQFGISLETLTKFNVSPAKYVWLDEEIAYSYTSSNPCYIYHFVDYEYKLYFPLSKDLGQAKFWTNCRRLQGLAQLDPSRSLCVITKSLKDVMTLAEYGINAVAPASENGIIEDKVISYLREKYELLLLFDNDETGKTWGKANAEAHEMPDLYLPVELGKDISDCRRDWGTNQTRRILETLKIL